jgi:hypothetical protein
MQIIHLETKVFRFITYNRTNFIIVDFGGFAVVLLTLLVVTCHSWRRSPVQNNIQDEKFIQELGLRSGPGEHVGCQTQLERFASEGLCDDSNRSLTQEFAAPPVLIPARLPKALHKRTPLLRNNGHRQQMHDSPVTGETTSLITLCRE